MRVPLIAEEVVLCRSARRFQQMLHVMQDGMPETQIVILGLYPRGADFGDNRFQWPNHFTYPIELLNAQYEVDPLCPAICIEGHDTCDYCAHANKSSHSVGSCV